MDRRRLISGGVAGDVLKKVLDPNNELQAELGAVAGALKSPVGGLQHFSFRAMACDVQFFFPLDRYPAAPEVAMRCMELVEQLENSISIYRPGSDICRINQLALQRAVPVGGFVGELVPLALEWHAKTDGAFDCTLGPLSRLWGFRNRQPRLPDSEEVARTLKDVGSRFLEWDSAERTLRITNPNSEVDFNGIGKGFVIGKIAESLRAKQIGDWMIHAGQSSVMALGNEVLESNGWTVGVSHPLVPRTRIAEIVLRDQSLGTSGSARQAFVSEGKRYGHVLDPRTGWPATHWVSMTVVHDSPIACDVLSTALFVMSPVEVDQFAAKNSEAKIFGVRVVEDSESIELVSRNFAAGELTISS